MSGARETSAPAQQQQDTARRDCREEVAAAFRRLKTSGRPYRKETTVTVDQRTYRETVEFVPPDRMRLSDNGIWIMSGYYIWIGQRAWANWSPFPWGWREDYADPRFMQMKLADSAESATAANVPAPATECLGKVEFDGTAYLGYRARVDKKIVMVVPPGGALSDTQKRELARIAEHTPQEWRTVFVDPQSALPVYELVAQANQLGNPSVKVRYAYPSSINIAPPLWCRLASCRPSRAEP